MLSPGGDDGEAVVSTLSRNLVARINAAETASPPRDDDRRVAETPIGGGAAAAAAASVVAARREEEEEGAPAVACEWWAPSALEEQRISG